MSKSGVDTSGTPTYTLHNKNMLVYNGTANVQDKQIENGCAYFLFDLEKKTGANTVAEFLGDQDINTCDKLDILYTSRGGGQKSIMPNLPVLPLICASTNNEGFASCIYDSSGKIIRMKFRIQIGANGALALDNNSYLSLTTNFSDVKNLTIYSVDGVKTNAIIMYETIHFNAATQKYYALVGASHMITPKHITSFNLVRPEGYNIDSKEAELEELTQSSNEVSFFCGTETTYQEKKGGQTVTSKPVFKIQDVIAGGIFYDVIGVSDAVGVYMTMAYDDRVILVKTADARTL